MGLVNNTRGVIKRAKVIFFLIDTSGSMYGNKMGTLNETMKEVLEDVKDISRKNMHATIKLAVIDFSTHVKWITPDHAVSADEFVWRDLEASGVTNLGEACLELSKKLSLDEYLKEKLGVFLPSIVLLSDGEPTDDYYKGLEELRKNKMFNAATKAAIAIGKEAKTDILSEFTGNSENVFTANNSSQLNDLIKFVTITLSQLSSKFSNDNPEQEEVSPFSNLEVSIETDDNSVIDFGYDEHSELVD